jgi:hypothetical protein
MAKKSRRARRARPSTDRIRSTTRPSLRSQSGSSEVDFATEYHYVVEDLKRIAIIALILLVLLIALALLIG